MPELNVVVSAVIVTAIGVFGLFVGRKLLRKHLAKIDRNRDNLAAQVKAYEQALSLERKRRDEYERELMILQECLHVAESRESQLSSEIKALTMRLNESQVRLSSESQAPTLRLWRLDEDDERGSGRWGGLRLQ